MLKLPIKRYARYKVDKLAKQNRIILLLSFLDGVFQYYDFFAFSLLFFYLLKILDHHLVALYGIALISLLSFLVRPIGYRLQIKIVKHFKPHVIDSVSTICMSLAIISTGLVPNTHNYWIIFPWLACWRILHGISCGINQQTNWVIIKTFFPNRTHKVLARHIIGAQVGLTAAVFINKLLYTHLTMAQMAWGWRIPFFLGGLISLIFYILKKRIGCLILIV